MESFVEKNRARNQKFSNLKLICADVMTLDFDESCYDVIFSNWLFMYLSDDDIRLLTSRMLTWLKAGGKFFLRESCYQPSGNIKRSSNPTLYRSPLHYNKLIGDVECVDDDNDDGGINIGFDLIYSKQIRTYIEMKQNKNQICWLFQSCPRARFNFQQFLDEQQFSDTRISFYQQIHGTGFVNSGGHNINERFSSLVQIGDESKVLDVGCGIGGNSAFIAQQFGCDVTGIDLSMNLIENARRNFQHEKLHFHVADARKVEFPRSLFDVIISRDTLFYAEDKHKILQDFHKWLKPGGKILIVDYCSNPVAVTTPNSDDVTTEFYMISMNKYQELLDSVGFTHVTCRDITDALVESLTEDLNNKNNWHQSEQQQLQQQNSNENVAVETNSKLQESLKRFSSKHQLWGLFVACK